MSKGEGVNTEYRIVVRFGDELLQAGFTAVPNLVLNHYTDLGISPTEMMFIIHVWQYWWTEKDPYPSLKTIAAKMGTTWRNAQRYVASLREKGYLRVTPRLAPGLGQMTNEYDFSPLTAAVVKFDDSHDAAPTSKPSWGGMSNLSGGPTTRMSSEEDEAKQDPEQADENIISNGKYGSSLHKAKSDLIVNQKVRKRTNVENFAPTHNRISARPAAPSGWATVGELLPGRQPQGPVPDGRQGYSRRGRPPKAPPYIENVMADISGRLHDDNPRSSLTRATKLYRVSGMSEQDFVHQVLYPARSTSQAQGNVKKRATVGHGLVNRMPYFFAVVEDLLGLSGTASDQP